MTAHSTGTAASALDTATIGARAEHPPAAHAATAPPGATEDAADDGPAPPRLPDGHTLAVTVLAILAVFYTLYLASDFILPVVLAVVLNLLLQPPKRFLCGRLRFPAPIASVVLILGLVGLVGAIGAAISVPASGWIGRAPESLPILEEKLSVLRRPLAYMQQGFHQFEQMLQPEPSRETGGRRGDPQAASGPAAPQASTNLGSVGLSVLAGTRAFVGNVFMLLVLLFFLLSSGDSLLRRLVEIVPRFRDKKRLVQITEAIEHNVSSYLATITMMNLAVGVANGISTWACGLPDPLLWGTVAFLLNYIPILGPFCGIVIFFLVGLFTYSDFWRALIPAAIYLAIHVAEGETITPMLLASRFTLNPVSVILALFFWDWIWGVTGALLAVPLLAIFKIVCDHIPSLAPFGHIVSGPPKPDRTGKAAS